MKRVLFAATLVLSVSGASIGLLTTSASATVFGAQTPSCSGVTFTPIAVYSPVTITLSVGSVISPPQTVTTAVPITFLWSSVGVNASAGGTITYSFTWTNSPESTPPTYGPFTYNAASCVATTTTVAATTTTVAATTTTVAATTTTVAATTTTVARALASTHENTTTTVPKVVSAGAAKPVASASTASKVVSAGAAKPVAGATSVHTGEPWAGSGPLMAIVLSVGLMMVGLGELLRRRRRSTSL